MAIVKKLSKISLPRPQAGVKQAVTQQSARPISTPVRTAPTPVPQPVLSKPQPARRPAALPPAVQQRARQALMQSRPIQQTMPPSMTAPQSRSMPLPTQMPAQQNMLDQQLKQNNLMSGPALPPIIESVPTDPVTGQQTTPTQPTQPTQPTMPTNVLPPAFNTMPVTPAEDYTNSDYYQTTGYKKYLEQQQRMNGQGQHAMMMPDVLFGGSTPEYGQDYIDYLIRNKQQFGYGLNEQDKARMMVNPDLFVNLYPAYYNYASGSGVFQQDPRQAPLNQMVKDYMSQNQNLQQNYNAFQQLKNSDADLFGNATYNPRENYSEYLQNPQNQQTTIVQSIATQPRIF